MNKPRSSDSQNGYAEKIAESSSNSVLFREEILEAQSSQWMGAIRLAQPISLSLISIVAIAIAISVITFIVFGEFTKKAHVSGITVPSSGSLSIIAPNSGTIVRSLVREGQKVDAGQAMFELSTARQVNQGEITELVEQQIAIRRQSLDAERRTRIAQESERKRAIDARLLNLDSEKLQLEQEIELAHRRQQLAQKSLGKFETLQQNGFVSAAQTQQKQEDLIDITSRLSTLSRAKVQLEASRISLQGERDSLTVSLATEMTQLDRAHATLTQESAENQNRRSSIIVAPQTGTVTAITYQSGHGVVAGQSLATIVPINSDIGKNSADLEVHLFAPSRTAGFVAAGQNVLIRYQAFPYQKFGLHSGKVVDVSRTPFAPSELPANLASTILGSAQQNIPGFNSNEALYRIKVRLVKQSINTYGKEQPLKPGMTLDADIVQDHRAIWEWIAEPVLAVSRR